MNRNSQYVFDVENSKYDQKRMGFERIKCIELVGWNFKILEWTSVYVFEIKRATMKFRTQSVVYMSQIDIWQSKCVRGKLNVYWLHTSKHTERRCIKEMEMANAATTFPMHIYFDCCCFSCPKYFFRYIRWGDLLPFFFLIAATGIPNTQRFMPFDGKPLRRIAWTECWKEISTQCTVMAREQNQWRRLSFFCFTLYLLEIHFGYNNFITICNWVIHS